MIEESNRRPKMKRRDKKTTHQTLLSARKNLSLGDASEKLGRDAHVGAKELGADPVVMSLLLDTLPDADERVRRMGQRRWHASDHLNDTREDKRRR